MKATVVIVNWNTGKLLKDCLMALAALPEKDDIAEVIVVDNASHDDSFAMAKQVTLGVPVTFMGLHANVGFAAANNTAIRQRRDKTSHVLLLNPDTTMQPGAIKAGLVELQEHPKTGVVGLTLHNPDHTLQPSVRTLPTFGTLVFLFLKLHRLFPTARLWLTYMQTDLDYTKRQVVEQVMGAVFFVRREMLDTIGLLDEQFWVWFEEVDFCQRVREAGWDVVYTPSGTVTHYGGVSFHQLIGLRKRLPFLRSALLYARKHFSFVSFVTLVLLWPVALSFAIPASLRHVYMRSKNKERMV